SGSGRDVAKRRSAFCGSGLRSGRAGEADRHSGPEELQETGFGGLFPRTEGEGSFRFAEDACATAYAEQHVRIAARKRDENRGEIFVAAACTASFCFLIHFPSDGAAAAWPTFSDRCRMARENCASDRNFAQQFELFRAGRGK